MKNGYMSQAYPIKLENNDFSSGQDKAEAFANLFAENSLSSNLNPSIIKFRKEEEQKEEYKDAIPNECHYLNSPLQYDEFIETLESFASNFTAVGIGGISYQIISTGLSYRTYPILAPQMPQWEHINARFDTDYTDLKKSESTNILAIQVREHLNNNYKNHIKICTDGSVLDSLDSGAELVIPDLKVQKYFYLGKGFSIFTSELCAILMALNYI